MACMKPPGFCPAPMIVSLRFTSPQRDTRNALLQHFHAQCQRRGSVVTFEHRTARDPWRELAPMIWPRRSHSACLFRVRRTARPRAKVPCIEAPLAGGVGDTLASRSVLDPALVDRRRFVCRSDQGVVSHPPFGGGADRADTYDSHVVERANKRNMPRTADY